MLLSAESDLVRRDRAIPGLSIVLDPDAFVGALRRAEPEADLRMARVMYVRYKPQRYCRVAYRLDLAGTELDVDVRACRHKDLARWLEAQGWACGAGTREPGCLLRLVLDHCAVVVSVFPNDPKLPVLQHLAHAEERKRLLSELLPDQPGLWQGELRCLRYRPERRYVAELSAADETRGVLKTYTARAYTCGKRNAQAFHSHDRLRIARVLGHSDSHRLLAFEWLPGRLVMDLIAAPEIDCKALTATGAALATLHAQDPDGLGCWTPQDEAADLLSLSSEIGFICPRLERQADDLARRLAGQLAGAPAVHCAMHGDFSANQVLVGQEEVAIIDLDGARYGDPADDLGNFIAQAERKALRGELAPGRVELVREALLEGYTLATNCPLPQRIGLYTAAEVSRRARFPFRAREPDWPQRTEALLERAEAMLDSLG